MLKPVGRPRCADLEERFFGQVVKYSSPYPELDFLGMYPHQLDSLSPEQKGCWVWGHGKTPYGCFEILGTPVPSHTFSYELVNGPIPEGLIIDHLCRTTRCVNPDHLEAVTYLENALRGKIARKTHCKNGHELSVGSSQRFCRVCCNERNKAYQAAQKLLKAVKPPRTHCSKGHPYLPGRKKCRECNYAATRRYKARKAGSITQGELYGDDKPRVYKFEDSQWPVEIRGKAWRPDPAAQIDSIRAKLYEGDK